MRARSQAFGFDASVPLSVVLIAFAALACSGESDAKGEGDDGTGGSGGSGGGGSGGMLSCDPSSMPTDPTAVIDDLEDEDALIVPIGDRNGGWWVSSDGSGGTIVPQSDAAPPPERIPGKRCDSEFAMRLTGQGFTAWGAVLSLGFRYTTESEPVDVSSFKGVMFWARTGETHNSPVRVQFQDSNTQPEGGVCDPEPSSADECYNGWGTELAPISTEWRLYKIDFSRMTQRDFGHRAEAFDTTAVFDIEWNLSTNSVFDLWIDDLWFYD
jgi:hypothetical protein